MQYYYITAIVTAIIVAFLVVTACISDYFTEKYYSEFPDEIKQGGIHSFRVASPRPPASFKLAVFLSNLVKIAVTIFIIMLFFA